MANNNLYYQVRRLRNSKYKIEVELKNEKFNRSVDYMFSQDNILYLKKIIILQASCMAAILITKIFT
jgi:hypothetical protein